MTFPRCGWAVLLACGAGCSSLPTVQSPTGTGVSGPPVVVRGDAALSQQDGAAKIREVQAEGRARLLARHIGMLGPLGEVTTSDNDVRLLIDGPATFAAMFAELENAQTSIQMESYIFESESLGEKVAAVLKRKASEGVGVRLIYDAVGSLATPASFFNDLAEAGVQVCQFNPVRPPALFGTLNHRDHRKMLIVDGNVAITGGINVSDVYSAGSASVLRRSKPLPADGDERDKPQKGWRDTSVRIQGPAVADFASLFATTWRRQSCAEPPVLSPRQGTPPLSGDRLVTVLGSTPDDPEPRIYRALLTAIGSARRSVHMTMSYFVPDPQTADFLAAAAQRGVDVTLLLQGESDSMLTLRAGQSHYTRLLAAGVKIYERRDTLLHAKTAVIDGVWATVGSSNVDWRSFRHNDEISVIVFGADFAREMETLFRNDLQQAEPVTAEVWAERGVSRRLMEGVGRLFEYWL